MQFTALAAWNASLAWQFGHVQQVVLEQASMAPVAATHLRACQHSIVQLTDLLHTSPLGTDELDVRTSQQSQVGGVIITVLID